MRLVDVAEFYSEFGGGVKTYVHHKLEACANAGVEATIIAPGPADRRERRLGGEIIWVKSPVIPFDHRYWLFADSKPVHGLLDEIKPDIIEGSSTWRGAWIAANWRGAAARALFLHQDPVAVYPQSLLSPFVRAQTVDAAFGWFWFYLRKLASRFDATVVPSQWYATRLRERRVADAVVRPLGVNKAVFSHELRDEALRREMLAACGVDDPDAILFVTVGRHHIEKRLPMVFDAFQRISAKRAAGLYVIGDGPMWRTVSSAARRAPGVFVAGVERDRGMLARRFASADYLVHGGAAETFGLVVAEALNSGLPIIAPDTGGATDMCHPAFSETYRAGDSRALGDAIERMLTRDRASLSLAARAGAKRLCTPEEHFAALLELYGNLADGRRQRRAA